MKPAVLLIELLILQSVVSGCRAPVLKQISPAIAFPRQIVAVEGRRLEGSDVRWDVGLQSERSVHQSLGAATYFQIPTDADSGPHRVCLQNSGGVSDTFVVVVRSISGNWPLPRIEDIGINSFHENGDGFADILLAVAVANADSTAEVYIDDSLRQSVFYSAIPNPNFLHHDASTFKYPVYHYALLLVDVPKCPLGKTLRIHIKNADGVSVPRDYQLPPSSAELDSDNDGLLDSWEISGYPTPSGATINLKKMGCDPHRKDILVEVDWVRVAKPNDLLWPHVKNIFAYAPILNPDGSQGISIYLEHNGRGNGGGQELPDSMSIDFGPSSNRGQADFYSYKNDERYFDWDRTCIFHYCIFGREMPMVMNRWSPSGNSEIVGNDFIVAFYSHQGYETMAWRNPVAQVGTFVHELGHNLGLRHGGIDNGALDMDETWKPNQESSMNYRYQMDGVCLEGSRKSKPIHTYSQGMYATIDESKVNENTGICDDTPADFNGDEQWTNGRMNVNYDQDSVDILINYDEWGNLRLNFRNSPTTWDYH